MVQPSHGGHAHEKHRSHIPRDADEGDSRSSKSTTVSQFGNDRPVIAMQALVQPMPGALPLASASVPDPVGHAMTPPPPSQHPVLSGMPHQTPLPARLSSRCHDYVHGTGMFR